MILITAEQITKSYRLGDIETVIPQLIPEFK